MIKADISNVWGSLSLPELLAVEKEIFDAHMALTEGEEARQIGEELQRILTAGERIREHSDVLVVLGDGSLAEAALGLLGNSEDVEILFAGNTLSTRAWHALQRQLEGKDFSIAIISRSGTDTAPAIATRALRWMLERKYGTDGARKRTFAVTEEGEGALCRMAREDGWELFSPELGSLLPMAVAGMDIEAVIEGAREARAAYDLRSFENPVWLYAGVRSLLRRKGMAVELLSTFEPDFQPLGRWWQQLFSKLPEEGLFPVCAEYPAQLDSLGKLAARGNTMETFLRFASTQPPVLVGSDYKNLDGLNALEGKSLEYVDEQAYQEILEAHADSGVPVITLLSDGICEKTLGELFYFLELAANLCAARPSES